MKQSGGQIGPGTFCANFTVRPIGLDDFASLRYLHATALTLHTGDSLSDREVASLVRLIYSPAYSDLVMHEDVSTGWVDDELVGSASWHANTEDGSTARIGSIFVRHPRLGIGRRLLAEVESRALKAGFQQFAVAAIGCAVPFFARLGYVVASRGVKTLSADCVLPVTFLRKSTAHGKRLS